jgi:hypothetical protein
MKKVLVVTAFAISIMGLGIAYPDVMFALMLLTQ